MSDPAGGGDKQSMEEIMATIGKAVSEQSRGGGPAPQEAGTDDDILELVDKLPPETGADEAAPPSGEDELVSTVAAAASAEAFAGLAEAVEKNEVAARRLPVREGGETIEDMIRTMLKPMLNEWLDAHLPDIVERLVSREIQRLSLPGRR